MAKIGQKKLLKYLILIVFLLVGILYLFLPNDSGEITAPVTEVPQPIAQPQSQPQGQASLPVEKTLPPEQQKVLKQDVQPKTTERFDPYAIRYTFLFVPEIGMKTKVKTKITREVLKNGKRIEKNTGTVLHSEEVISVIPGGNFTTRIKVNKVQGALKDLNYYKFMQMNEERVATYSMNGKLKKIAANGATGDVVWRSDNYLNFMFPVKKVGLGQKWGAINGSEPLMGEMYTFELEGFAKFKSFNIAKIKYESTSETKKITNDKTDNSVPANVSGYFLINLKNGSILYYKIHEDYSYLLFSNDQSYKEVSFVYEHETY